MSNNLISEELQSKTFDFLRFPLIIGVIFIHNYGLNESNSPIDIQSYNTYYVCNQLFSQIIGRIAVPLFYLMSGYLFFYKTDFNISTYKRKLNSRIKSLLIPYLFWNVAFIVVYFIVNRIPYISSFFHNNAEYSIKYFIESLWGKPDEAGTMTYPIAYQFWFIRDLIVVILFTPILFKLLKITRCLGIVILGLCWYLGLTIPYIGIYGFSTTAFFFFSLGAYFSIRKKNIVTISKELGFYSYILYLIVASADLFTIGLEIHPYIHKLGIMIGIIASLNITAYLIEKKNFNPNTFLSKASFFVFAIHDPWILSTLRKIIERSINVNGGGILTCMYFIEVIITACTGLLIYKFLKKIMPRFIAVITGGR